MAVAAATAAALAWTSIMEMSKELVSLTNQWNEKGKMYVLCLRRDIWKSWLSFVTAFLFTILKWREQKNETKEYWKLIAQIAVCLSNHFSICFCWFFFHTKNNCRANRVQRVCDISKEERTIINLTSRYFAPIFFLTPFFLLWFFLLRCCFAPIFFLTFLFSLLLRLFWCFQFRCAAKCTQFVYCTFFRLFPRWREKKMAFVEMVFATIFNSLIPWIVYIALNNFTVDEYK